jgi:hypothetical protein
LPRESAGRPAERKPIGPERPADFDKLPKRFRDYVRELEHRLHALEALTREEAESSVYIETYSTTQERRYLPDSTRLCFALPDGKVVVEIGKRRGTETLQVSSPDGRLLVYPEISNEIGIKVGRI